MSQTRLPLRILHLTAGSDAGGLSRYIYDLCKAMRELGHEVAVAGEHGAWHWLFERAPWPWIDVPLKGGPFALGYATQLLKAHLHRHPVDIIHTHYRKPTLVARRLQKIFGTPILYTSHLSNISLRWPMRWFTDFGDWAHAPSEEVRQWLIDEGHFPQDRIALIPHGVDPEKFPIADDRDRFMARTQLKLENDDLVASFIGRLDIPKNEEWMLDLANQSRQELPNLKILLAGEGPHEAMLRERIEKENLQDRVRLLGHCDPLPVYQASDAVLSASMREGFSLVTAEAMSVGVPVFRTQSAGYSSLIKEGETGRSCPIEHDAFVKGAIDFLSKPNDLRRMGQTAAAHIRQHFTFDRQVEQTIGLYYSMISQAQP